MERPNADHHRIPRHLDRRRFLAQAVAFSGLQHLLPAPNKEQIGYIGTYTKTSTEGVTGSKGLYSFYFDPEQGTIDRIRLACSLDNPSYLATTQSRRRMVAACEVGTDSSGLVGRLVSLALNSDGTARLTGTANGVGSMPCCVALDDNERTAFCTSYEDGNLSSLHLTNNGHLQIAQSMVPANTTNALKSRLHHVCFSPKETSLLVADFGADRLLIYSLEDRGLPSKSPSQVLHLGAKRGPRSIDHAPGTQDFYCLNQVSSTLMHLRWLNDSRISLLSEHSCLPADYIRENFPSCIRVSPNGWHVLISNRGHDSIAVFARSPDGMLGKPRFFACGGEFPRHFCFDHSGRWLLCGNQYSNQIAVFRIDPQSGNLALHSRSPQIMAPAFIDL